ncbi:MAG: hypothetical protein SGARI_005843, partial [Bacillariaceae sp.]
MPKAPSLYRTPEQIYANGVGTPFQDPVKVAKSIKRLKALLPGILSDDPSVSEEDFFDTRQVQAFATKAVNARLEEMTTQQKHHLMKREHEVDMCVALGMRKGYASLRCSAVAAILREMKTPAKMSIVDSILGLIESLHLDNPFGETITPQMREACEWLSYEFFELEKGKVEEGVEQAIRYLKSIQCEDSYMHGTTSAVLKGVFEEGGMVKYST